MVIARRSHTQRWHPAPVQSRPTQTPLNHCLDWCSQTVDCTTYAPGLMAFSAWMVALYWIGIIVASVYLWGIFFGKKMAMAASKAYAKAK